ncbi:hypothetical protein V6O07_03140, partial [Arthrospira platensis SPKY2]
QRIARCLLRKQDNPIGGNINFNISKYNFQDIEVLAATLGSDIKEHIGRVLPDIFIEDLDVIQTGDKQIAIIIQISGQTANSKKKYLFNLEQDNKNNINLKKLVNITE